MLSHLRWLTDGTPRTPKLQRSSIWPLKTSYLPRCFSASQCVSNFPKTCWDSKEGRFLSDLWGLGQPLRVSCIQQPWVEERLEAQVATSVLGHGLADSESLLSILSILWWFIALHQISEANREERPRFWQPRLQRHRLDVFHRAKKTRGIASIDSPPTWSRVHLWQSSGAKVSKDLYI